MASQRAESELTVDAAGEAGRQMREARRQPAAEGLDHGVAGLGEAADDARSADDPFRQRQARIGELGL
jgi:hypothetical protein